jgi:hypothetical protein
MPSTIQWIGGAGSLSWTSTANWSGGVVPATGDIVYIRNSASSIDIGLGQSAVLLAQLIIEQTFTGRIGGSNGTPLAIGFTYGRIGDPGGTTGTVSTGAGAIHLDSGTNPATLEIVNTKNSGTDTGLEPVRWIGNNAANVVVVMGGTVGIATTSPTQTATLDKLIASGGAVNCGPGMTWLTAQNKGTMLIQSGNGTNTTLTNLGGTCTCQGPVYLHAVTLKAGTFNFNNRTASGSSIGTVTLHGGTLDTKGDGRAFTVNSLSFRAGAISLFQENQATFTTMALDFTNKDEPNISID